MLEIRDLRLILAIDEHGSLVRAARALGIAQPAVTRNLAALEAKLRGPLFERGARGAMATDLGRAVISEAREILGRIAHLNRHLADVRGSQLRDLKVVAGAYMGESIGIRAAARMMELYPTIRLRLAAANWTEVPRAVLEREASVGLLDLRGFPGDPGLEVERLCPLPALFFARPGHPLTLLDKARLEDIMAYPFIFIGHAPREVHAPLVAAREAARAAGPLHPAFPAMVHESPTVALSVLPHSDAVVAATIAIAGRMLRQGDVAALRWRAPWVCVQPGILRLRNKPMDEAEQGFRDLLHSASQEAEREGIALCEELGVTTECA